MSDEKKNDFAVELGEKGNGNFEPKERTTSSAAAAPASQVSSQPMFAIFAYCGSSILMTVTNKYVLTGTFNLNFFLLAIQSVVCILAIQSLKVFGFAKFRDYNNEEARKWFPITLLLIGMIYTSSKALQYLSIPVYTIFKNLTTILIAYGEVIWFGGSVTSLALLSFGLMVLSSVIAAWADIGNALSSYGDSAAGQAAVATLNSGYMWMMLNCFCTAAYLLSMRKRIKLTNFKDFDTMFYNNLLSIPVLLFASLFTENWSSANIDINFPPSQRSWTVMVMLISGLSTVFISYSSAWCVRITSSTTYSMVGALNKLPIAISGLVFFDAPVTVASVSAIFVGFVSGLVYTLSKIWDKQKDTKNSSVLPTTSASAQSVRDGHKS